VALSVLGLGVAQSELGLPTEAEATLRRALAAFSEQHDRFRVAVTKRDQAD
jgi:hypothetical protein